MMSQSRMSVILIMAVLSLHSTFAKGQDLENLLASSGTSKAAKNSSMMADVLKSLLKTPTADQNHLLRLLEESKWTEALIQWKPAFANSALSRQDDFRAYKALLMFKNSMTVTGLEELFLIKEQKKIHLQILNQWREAAG